MDYQTFGAAVVSKTLDYMNSSPSAMSFAPTDKQTFGAAVVSKTLDYMNSGSFGGLSPSNDFDFQTSVLSAVYTGKGTIADMSM